jgi:penicillin-binding protein 1A
LVPGTLVGFAVAVAGFYLFQSVPLPESVGAQATLLVDSAGREIGTLRPEASREDITLDELPDHVINAVLAAEDARFYSHRGVSLPGVVRAALSNARSGSVTQGGSTISQQYIKNVTDDSARTIERKLREAVLAVKLEQSYSKDEILTFYLNSIYWGRGAYGIEAAAKAYFGPDRPASSLTPQEAALLAGIIQAPSALDPAKNLDGATRRYRYVLDQLVENEWLDPVTAGQYAASQPTTVEARSVVFKEAPFFLDIVQRELVARVDEEDIYSGLTVTTTLDLGVQRNAEAVYGAHFAGLPDEQTAALVAVDPATGGVRALVGGRDYAADQVNTALALRPPGSTFKPFALATWVEQGNSPNSYFDAPADLTFPAEVINEPKDWDVENYEGEAFGAISLTEATWKSVNTVYAQLLAELGKRAVIDTIHRAGVKTNFEEVASVVLGSTAVTPLELAAAYNTLAAGGIERPWFTIETIARGDDVLFRRPIPNNRVLAERTAWTVTEVLEGVITRGTGTAADIDRPAAGKTGTTDNYADAWFAGYTPHLTAVVWMGNRDNNEPMPEKPTGGGLPAQAWGAFMSATLTGIPPQDFPEPAGGLTVTRPSPTPIETEDDEPACDADEVETETTGEDGDTETVCVEASPTEEASPSPSPSPSAESEEPVSSPAPAPSPPPATAPPTATPSPTPTRTRAPQPSPSPTAPSEPTPAPTQASSPAPSAEPTEDAAATGDDDA